MANKKQSLDTLREIGAGRLLDDLTNDLHMLQSAVKATDKKGEVNIKIKLDPATKNDASMVVWNYEITEKLPKADTPSTLMYMTPEGNTQLRNPAQPDLDGLKVAVDNEEEAKPLPNFEENNNV